VVQLVRKTRRRLGSLLNSQTLDPTKSLSMSAKARVTLAFANILRDFPVGSPAGHDTGRYTLASRGGGSEESEPS